MICKQEMLQMIVGHTYRFINFGKVLFPGTPPLLQIHSISFHAKSRTIWFGPELLLRIFPFFRWCFWSRNGICCTLFIRPGSFNGKSVHTWSKSRGKWVRFGNANNCWIKRAWLWFLIFWTLLDFPQLFSCFSWWFLYLFRYCTYLLWV